MLNKCKAKYGQLITKSLISSQISITFIISTFITTNCYGQTDAISASSTSTTFAAAFEIEPTAFYEDLDKLKYIAMTALAVLICCCLALLIFVRTQVRKTEQGTEIQNYIQKRRVSQEPPNQLVADSSHRNMFQDLKTDKVSQSQFENEMNCHSKPRHIAPSLRPQISATPGGPGMNGYDLNEENGMSEQNEIYLVQIAEQNEMKQSFERMHRQSLFENQADEDEDFGHYLNDAMQIEQNQQDKIFNDMLCEQQQQQQMSQKHRLSSYNQRDEYRQKYFDRKSHTFPSHQTHQTYPSRSYRF